MDDYIDIGMNEADVVEEEVRKCVENAQNAKLIYENPVIKGFIEDNIDRLFELLDSIPLNDEKSRARIYDMIWLFKKFDKTLKQHIELGETSLKKWREVLEMKKSVMEELKDRLF